MLITAGCSPIVAVASLVLQMCPTVHIRVLGNLVPVLFRTLGGLTGSRIAGAAGTAVIANVVHERARFWRPDGFFFGSECITIATWIDNIFAYGPSSLSVARILDDFAGYL